MDNVKNAVADMLSQFGINLDEAGLSQTPARVADSMAFLLSGYKTTASDVISGQVFESNASSTITQKNCTLL